jgi:two-component system cell cycle sensor histidine kinase/response regulator CckA
LNLVSLVELLCNNSVLLWTVDCSLRVTSISPLGVSPDSERRDAFLRVSLGDLLRSAGLDQALLEAHRRALEGHSARFEFSAADHHWLGHAEPLRGPEGQIEGVTTAVFNHTDHAFAEKMLRLSEQSYRSLIEEAPFAIARATLSGQLLQVNRAMVEMLCYESEQELLIRSLNSEVFAKPILYIEFVSGLSASGSVQGLESTWLRRDGKSISVSLAGRATRDDLGRISYIEILAENVTERKQLELQLRQAQKLQAVGQLAAGIAHDFNNLLTIIHGQVQMALAELPSGDTLLPRLQDVEAAANRAAKLTRQLLSFGRFQNPEAKVLNLNSVVAGLTQMLVLLVGKTITLEFIPGQQLGYVNADPAQLEQVLMNLVLNAKDATPDEGCTRISTENVRLHSSSLRDAGVAPAGDYVALSVIDNGHGMSAEIQARIFEPFFTTKKVGHGTGLGLATVYSIIKQSKGFIAMESELGAGTRFTIYLPRVAAPSLVDSPVPDSPVHGGGSETILFAEDEEMIRKFTSTFLTRLGYRVLAAADGLEAISLAKNHAGEIDLLITDIVMPRLGGRELAEDLRRTMPDLKILFISGYAGDNTIRQALRNLNAKLVQKPFPSLPAFAKTIREVLSHS